MRPAFSLKYLRYRSYTILKLLFIYVLSEIFLWVTRHVFTTLTYGIDINVIKITLKRLHVL